MRRFSLRAYFERHPGIPLVLASLAMADLAALSVKRLDHARATVHGNWALAVTMGVATSLTLIGLTVGWFWSAHRRQIRNSKFGLALIVCLTGLYFLVIAVTVRAVAPQVGQPEPVTTPVQLGAIAFNVPFYCGLLALCSYTFLDLRKKRRGRAVRLAAAAADTRSGMLTAVVSPDNARGWSIRWVRDGKTPKKLSAPTLTASTERATSAAAELFAKHPATATTDLQLAIYPGPFKPGPIWEVTGSPGALTATNKIKGRTICVATLEDLVAAIQAAPDGDSGDFMLQWTRPITDLPPGGHAHAPLFGAPCRRLPGPERCFLPVERLESGDEMELDTETTAKSPRSDFSSTAHFSPRDLAGTGRKLDYSYHMTFRTGDMPLEPTANQATDRSAESAEPNLHWSAVNPWLTYSNSYLLGRRSHDEACRRRLAACVDACALSPPLSERTSGSQ